MKVMKWEGLKTVVTYVVQELLVLQYDNKLALIQDQIRNHQLLVDWGGGRQEEEERMKEKKEF